MTIKQFKALRVKIDEVRAKIHAGNEAEDVERQGENPGRRAGEGTRAGTGIILKPSPLIRANF